MVLCSKLEHIIQFVRDKRNLIETHLEFGIDGPQRFLKICLLIQSTEEVPTAKTEFQDSGVKK